jgi:general secretion pathway protein I
MTDPARQGFSLVELMVALAVFSLAAMALLNLSGENIRSAARIEDRTLGGVVADNLAVETVLSRGLETGDSQGQVRLAERIWRWSRKVEPTDHPGLLRVEIRVASDEGLAADRTLVVERPS